MERVLNFENLKNIHFIGVGGVSMSALAEYSLKLGFKVSGSDIFASERTSRLLSLGCDISFIHQAKNVRSADAVVYSVAVSGENPELRYALKKQIPTFTRGEFLGKIINGYKNSIAVSGCHGKTTTTAMIANVLTFSGKDPTVFLGGDDYEFQNLRVGKSQVVVAEACEYKKSFLNLSPKISVVLNIGNDHLDTYGDMNELLRAFKEFSSSGISVINADDENAKKIIGSCSVTFGIDNTANYYATRLVSNNGFYSFTLNAHSKPLGRIKLGVQGKHNVYNALASFAVCDMMGVSVQKFIKAMENFKGVKRRNEFIGNLNGLNYYADYAHHPQELFAMLNTYRENLDKFITVFQPHTYSRTKLLMNDFVNVLRDVNPLIIYSTYPAREEFDIDGDAKSLYEKINKQNDSGVYYAQTPEKLKGIINELKDNKNVVVLGAGDIYDIVNSLFV